MTDLRTLIEATIGERMDLNGGVDDLISTLRRNSEYVRKNPGGDTGDTEILTKGVLEDSQAVVQASKEKARLLSRYYEPSDEVRRAVKMSEVLNKPIFIDGPPGGGKTAFAYWYSVESDADLIVFSGKNKADPSSLLYKIDNVSRFRDLMEGNEMPEPMRHEADNFLARLSGGESLGENTEFSEFMQRWDSATKISGKPEKVKDLGNYIVYGELGEAIMRSARGEKVVLLFDEIDKTTSGFEDNLLREIEELTISIRETGHTVAGIRENLKIVFTSNSTREMSEPFQRRFIYLHMEFPKKDQIEKIVRGNFPDLSENLLNSALESFYGLRSNDQLRRKPSTAELLDWIKLLISNGMDMVDVGTVPYPGLLVKNKWDLDLVAKMSIKDGGDEENEAIPALLREKLKGSRVVLFDQSGENGQAGLAKALIKNGIRVSFPADFDIPFPGVTKLDRDTFAFSGNGVRVLDILDEEKFGYQELTVLDEAPVVVQVDASNAFYGEYMANVDGSDVRVYGVGDKYYFYKKRNNEQVGIDSGVDTLRITSERIKDLE